jgi:hypothetical protein
LLLFMLLALPVSAAAQEPLPSIVGEGFELLVSSGSEAAIDHWTAAWTSEQDLAKQRQLKDAFKNLFMGLGAPDGYEIVHSEWIGSRLVEVFAVTAHRQQPLFFYLRAYRAPAGWMITQVNAHTSIDEVFPDWVMLSLRN